MGKSGYRLFRYFFILFVSTISFVAEAENPPVPGTSNGNGQVVLTPPNINAQQLGGFVNGSAASLAVGPVSGSLHTTLPEGGIARQVGAALSADGSTAGGTRDAGPGNRTPSGGATPCEIFFATEAWTLRDLDYVGFPFTERFNVRHCINAYTDQQAREATGPEQCPNSTNGRIINMGNPQYFSQQDAQRLQAIARQHNIGNGNYEMARDSNPFGYYLCVTRNPAYEKSAICEGMNNNAAIRSQSGWPSDVLSRLEFRWVDTSDGDGDCQCRTQGEGNWQLCTRPEDIPEEPCARYGMQPDTRPASERTAGVTMCQCQQQIVSTATASAGGQPVTTAASDSLAVTRYVVPGAPCEPVEPEAEPIPPTEPTAELRRCVESWREKSARCGAVSQTARTACAAAEQQNRPSNQAVQALSGASDFHNQVRAGSGAQNECFEASLISSSAINTIQGQQQSCDNEYNSCVASCVRENAETFEQACLPLVTVNASNAPVASGLQGAVLLAAREQVRAQQQSINQQYFEQHRGDISAAFTRGGEVCSGEVREGRSLTDRTLSSLGDSLSQSTRCMCQLSASGGNCATATPTVAECTANPSLPACSIYQALNACAPGASYNAVACNCELNPMTAGCRSATTNSLSSFASSNARIAAAAAVGAPPGVATASAGMPSSGVDLSGEAGEGDMAGLASGDGSDGLGQGAGPVVGGAAGGLGGGGTVSGTEGEGEDEKKSGLSGMFNSAKTFLSKLRGSKSQQNGALGKGGDRIGPNGFPRGLASERGGLAKKNTDIWKLMNACVQGETCRANQGNYITAP